MKKQLYASLLILIAILLPLSGWSQQKAAFPIQPKKQPPTVLPAKMGQSDQIMAGANNECAGATPLTFEVPVSDNNIGATQSLPPINCNSATSSIARDVWFTFTYTSEMDSLVVIPQNDNSYDIVIELFAGSCTNLLSIACADFAEPNSNNQTEGFLLSNIGVIPGSTYKLRVYGYNNVTCNFTVLLKNGTVAPPANDLCTNAKTLFAGNTTGETSVGATQSIAPILCNNVTSANANDVWFKFVKTAGMDTLAIYPSTSIDYVLEVRSNNCTGGTSLACSDKFSEGGSEKVPLTTLTNGTTYLARVYGIDGTAGEFSIRIKTGPANNNCQGAVSLTAAQNCNAALSGSTVDASQSLPATACQGNTGFADDDVWYSFVMQNGMDTLRVVPGTFFNAVLEVRSGTCASSTSILCSNNPTIASATEKIYVGGLVPGTTYFARVYSFGNGEGFQGSFQICLTTAPPAPPSNDNCTNPILINANEIVNGNNINATQTAPGVPCGGFVSPIVNDVWYRFTKTDAVDSIIVDGLGVINLRFDVRSNLCPNGNVVACSEVEGTEQKKLDISMVANGTYLLRVYGNNGSTGSFTVFLKDAVATTAPANDDCFDATNLIVAPSCAGTSGTNVAATESLAAGTCSGSGAGEAKDVWYSFTANSTKAIARLVCGIGFDGAIEVFSGSCFGPTSIACADIFGASTPDDAAVEQLILQGLSIGQQYFVRVYGYQGAEGNFSICIFNPSCTSTPAVLTTSSGNIVSNEAFTTSVIGATGLITYETSANQTVWTTAFQTLSTTDTVTGTGASNSILYIRVSSTSGNCYPANSNVVPVNIRCATPFTNSSATNDYITKFTLGTINNSSTRNPLGGNVQNFSNISTGLCRGSIYPVGITSNIANQAYNRLVWIDYNQDGDFGDAGENVILGSYNAVATSSNNITIPMGATLGTTRLRVALIDNSATITSSNPCATGPYLYGEIEEYSVTITSPLAANAGTNQTICAGTATLTGNNPGAVNSGLWTVVSGTGTFTDPTAFNTAVSGLSAGTNVFKWTLTTPCGSTNSDVTITTNLVIANAGTDQAVCTTSTNLAATPPTNGTGAWTLLSGTGTITNTASATSGITNLGTGTNRFIWTVTATGCPTVKDTVSITRNAEPSAAVAGTNQSLCASSGTLSATPPLVGTGTWSTTGPAQITNTGLANTTVTGLANGSNTFRWTVSNGNCTPKTDDVLITVQQPPVANAGADQNVCTTAVSIAATAVSSATYTWTLISGTGTISTPNTASTMVTGLGAGLNKIQVEVSKPGCPSDKDTVVISRKLEPVANAGINQTVCSPTTTLSATAPVSGVGIWTLVSGTGTISTPNSASSAVSGIGLGSSVFRWTVTDAPCPTATDEVTVTNNLPARPDAGINQTVCGIDNTVLTGSSSGTFSAGWIVLEGTGLVATPTSESTVVNNLSIGINRFIYGLAVPACSTAVTDTISVFRQISPVSLGKDTIICQNVSPTYQLIGPAGMSSYVWSNGAITQQITVADSNQYILTVQTPQNCSFSDTVVVDFDICIPNQELITKILVEGLVVPNPSGGESNMILSTNKPTEIAIEIFDSRGRSLHNRQIWVSTSQTSIKLPTGISPGAYTIRVWGEGFQLYKNWLVTQ